ncbi:hypothetical protein [Massilia sp. TS11]|uniref:tetratricopeptide repeat protein n=1 Tax=Massilia sp. TS11 TaxID=2908003 RepID=UPI001EDC29F6|nr:hypothetical protein [Massilia sp. TS11]MCG2582929.1 hypothetical protein [Massilia sp. TS11]
MSLAALGERVRAARSQRDQAAYVAIAHDLARFAAAQRAAPAPDLAHEIQQLIQDCHRWEAAWGLLLGEVLWQHGSQSAHEFNNHWNLALFSGCTGPHSLVDSASHLAIARELLGSLKLPALYILLGNALRALGQFSAAEDAYLQGQLHFPDYPFFRFRQADLYLATGRLRLAQDLLRPLQWRWPQAREMMFLSPLEGLAPVPAPPMPDLPATAREAVLLVAADPAYLERYGERLLRSIPVTSLMRLHVHIHVLADSEAELPRALLGRLAGHCSSSFFSFRRGPIAALDNERRRALLACERFLVLPEILSGYGKPVLVLDIDLECVGDPLRLLERLGEAELGCTDHQGAREAWEHVAATATLARPTLGAIGFFERLRPWLLQELNRHPAPWFVDQIGLFRMIEEGEGPRCALKRLRGVFCAPGADPAGAEFRVLHASWHQAEVGGT